MLQFPLPPARKECVWTIYGFLYNNNNHLLSHIVSLGPDAEWLGCPTSGSLLRFHSEVAGTRVILKVSSLTCLVQDGEDPNCQVMTSQVSISLLSLYMVPQAWWLQKSQTFYKKTFGLKAPKSTSRVRMPGRSCHLFIIQPWKQGQD